LGDRFSSFQFPIGFSVFCVRLDQFHAGRGARAIFVGEEMPVAHIPDERATDQLFKVQYAIVGGDDLATFIT
jgi:hypothetical protein